MKIIKDAEISEELKKTIVESFDCNENSVEADTKIGILLFDSESQESRNKIIHDIRSGIRTLKNAVENLQEGYKFDDNMAELKIQAIDRSVSQLEKHLNSLEEIQNIPQ